MKIVIAGGREFSDYDLLKRKCDEFISHYSLPGEDIEIISGTASGADMLGERYAEECSYSVKKFVPDWNSLGKKAGIIRNTEMAKYADHAIIFWDGESKGSWHMIQECNRLGLQYLVVNY